MLAYWEGSLSLGSCIKRSYCEVLDSALIFGTFRYPSALVGARITSYVRLSVGKFVGESAVNVDSSSAVNVDS